MPRQHGCSGKRVPGPVMTAAIRPECATARSSRMHAAAIFDEWFRAGRRNRMRGKSGDALHGGRAATTRRGRPCLHPSRSPACWPTGTAPMAMQRALPMHCSKRSTPPSATWRPGACRADVPQQVFPAPPLAGNGGAGERFPRRRFRCGRPEDARTQRHREHPRQRHPAQGGAQHRRRPFRRTTFARTLARGHRPGLHEPDADSQGRAAVAQGGRRIAGPECRPTG